MSLIFGFDMQACTFSKVFLDNSYVIDWIISEISKMEYS